MPRRADLLEDVPARAIGGGPGGGHRQTERVRVMRLILALLLAGAPALAGTHPKCPPGECGKLGGPPCPPPAPKPTPKPAPRGALLTLPIAACVPRYVPVNAPCPAGMHDHGYGFDGRAVVRRGA